MRRAPRYRLWRGGMTSMPTCCSRGAARWKQPSRLGRERGQIRGGDDRGRGDARDFAGTFGKCRPDGDRARRRRSGDRRRGRGCGGVDARGQGSGAAMIPVPSGVRVWLAVGHTDMRRGMNGLALLVQEAIGAIRTPVICTYSEAPGRSGQDHLARRGRHVALCQAAGTRPVPVAVAGGRYGGDLRRPARLHARGDRLAQPASYVAPRARGIETAASFFRSQPQRFMIRSWHGRRP